MIPVLYLYNFPALSIPFPLFRPVATALEHVAFSLHLAVPDFSSGRICAHLDLCQFPRQAPHAYGKFTMHDASY